jgi:hypothetical protein
MAYRAYPPTVTDTLDEDDGDVQCEDEGRANQSDLHLMRAVTPCPYMWVSVGLTPALSPYRTLIGRPLRTRLAQRSGLQRCSARVWRLAGAVLAVAIAGAHVADQGGITAFTAPDWLGWAFRLIEVGGVLTAVALIWPRTAWLDWAAGVLLGVAPFLGFLATRTVGVPGDPGDVGNWSDWVGTLALVLEAGLATVSVGMLQARLRRPSPVVAPVKHPDEIDSPASGRSRDLLRPAGSTGDGAGPERPLLWCNPSSYS